MNSFENGFAQVPDKARSLWSSWSSCLRRMISSSECCSVRSAAAALLQQRHDTEDKTCRDEMLSHQENESINRILTSN